MKRHTTFSGHLRTVVFLLYCLLVIAGCGSNISGHQATYNLLPPQNTVTIGSSLYPNVDIAGLHIEMDGMYCIPSASGLNLMLQEQFNPGVHPHRNLIVNDDQSVYDAGTSNQISTYLSATFDHLGELDVWSPPPPPSPLAWVSGGTMCTGALQITNTSASAITIGSVGEKLTAVVQANTHTYKLVDTCLHADCSNCPHCGGTLPCEFYAPVALSPAAPATVFETPLQGTTSECSSFVLTPGEANEIVLNVTVKNHAATIYQVTPTLKVTTADSTRDLALSKFDRQLSFTATDHFPCYKFVGNQFVAVSTSDTSDKNFCV